MNFSLRRHKYIRQTRQIQALIKQYQALGDEQLKAKTAELREQLAQGKPLDKLLVEAYATVCEAARRVLGMVPYDVQILGAVAMEDRNIIEMKTGEGKTLTAIMPMYLHGLTGPGNFLITANEYLANRDAKEMGVVYQWLGLTVMPGVAEEGSDEEELDRHQVYSADIVYTTNSALGFDYLTDNLASTADDRYMQGFNFALLDEADAVLLDSASTPLIISGAPRPQSNFYVSSDRLIKMLVEDEDFERSEDEKQVWFTPAGIKRMQAYFGVDDLLSKDWTDLYRHLVLALRANYLLKPDRDYIVAHGEVSLIDITNGRELTGMKLEAGMHQALEAKEGVNITQEMRAMAQVTFQNLFRMFHQLAGMTGTAATDASEFMEIYHLAVFKVPTHKPNIRKDRPDRLFISNEAKLLASLKVIRQAYEDKRPVLIETGSLALSNLYSRLLLREGIPHSLLNARSAAKEANIVAEAGQPGAVTVATSMAGRGTDIHLGDGVKVQGGLLVLGTERMDNPRVDNQLRGRAGRQGDPGESLFYASLEDRIVLQNAPRHVRKWTEKHATAEKQRLSNHGRFRHVIDNAQRVIAAGERSERFSTLQYGEVFRVQRDKIYEQRDAIIAGEDVQGKVEFAVKQAAQDFVEDHRQPDVAAFLDFVYQHVDRDYNPAPVREEPKLAADVDYLTDLIMERLAAVHEKLPAEDQWAYFERLALLKAIDWEWIEQVDNLQTLQSVTMNRSTQGSNPMYEYQKESRRSFKVMKRALYQGVLANLLCSELVAKADGTVKVNFP